MSPNTGGFGIDFRVTKRRYRWAVTHKSLSRLYARLAMKPEGYSNRRSTLALTGSGSPIRSIQPVDILQVLDGIVKNGNIETAHRVKTLISLVFRYAVATSRVDSDVTRDLTGYLPKTQVKHQHALVRPDGVSRLLKDIHVYQGHIATSAALKLSPLVFTRPGDTRKMLWEQIDFDKAQWELPTTKNGYVYW